MITDIAAGIVLGVVALVVGFFVLAALWDAIVSELNTPAPPAPKPPTPDEQRAMDRELRRSIYILVGAVILIFAILAVQR